MLSLSKGRPGWNFQASLLPRDHWADVKEIGIVGAGPGGLASLRAILEAEQYCAGAWRVTVFEAREDIGGVWLPGPVPDGGGLPSTPLYDSLTTNVPHPMMAFKDFPFPASTALFPSAEVVHAYLKSYARHFELEPHIRLKTRVTSVFWDGATAKWVVETSQHTTHHVDLLLISNGHYNIPRYPRIPGLEAWLASKRASHSIYYRNLAAPFVLTRDHTVLVAGGGPSGQDIVGDIAKVVKKVIHSAPSFVPGSKPEENVIRRGRTVRFLDDFQGVEFEGGVVETGVDYVLLATGYQTQFPFLPSSSNAPGGVHLQEGIPPPVPPLPRGTWNTTYGVFPLVRHLLPFGPLTIDHSNTSASVLPHPTSVVFLGLPVRVIPLPVLEIQAVAALAAFSNPDKVDWTSEAIDVMERYEMLKKRVGPDGPEAEMQVHKAWFWFAPQDQFDYRELLLEYIGRLESRGAGAHDGRVRRVRQWERDIFTKKDLLRRTWRALEATGDADDWVKGVGEGKAGKSGEEEWVELMLRVIKKGESEGDKESEEEKSRL